LTCQILKFTPFSRILKNEATGHKVTVRQEDHAPIKLHPAHLSRFARYDLGHFGTGDVGLIPAGDRSDTKEEPSRGAKRAGETMPNTDESQAAESYAPTRPAQSAATAGTIGRGGFRRRQSSWKTRAVAMNSRRCGVRSWPCSGSAA